MKKLYASLDVLVQKTFRNVRVLWVLIAVLLLVSSGLLALVASGLPGALRAVQRSKGNDTGQDVLTILNALDYFEAQGCDISVLRDIPPESWMDLGGRLMTVAHGSLIWVHKNNGQSVSGAWLRHDPDGASTHVISLEGYGIVVRSSTDAPESPLFEELGIPMGLTSSEFLDELSCLANVAQEQKEMQGLVPWE